MFTPLGGAELATPLQQSPLDPAISVQLSFDPVAALLACLVKQILDLDFVEMSDTLPDAWQEDSNPGRVLAPSRLKSTDHGDHALARRIWSVPMLL